MSKPYCGINSIIPVGYHPGKLSECVKANQVRRFGFYETSRKEVNELLASKKEKKRKIERKSYLISKLSSLTAQINKAKSHLAVTGSLAKTERSKALKRDAKENLPKLQERFAKYRKEYREDYN